MWKWLFLGFLLHVSWANAEDKLSVYVWSNSMPASTVKAFEARCHCRVEQSFYGDNEELLAKLAA
ncbi:MAG: spermidine/putrescine ABC transporter substrate-binding protein, partial [Iodobacter sp.]